MKLAIDPGHGGANTGTKAGGIREKRVNLKLARMLAYSLPPDVELVLLRDDDISVSFQARGHVAADFDADWVLSIHVNANPDPTVNGAEVYVLPGAFNLDGRLVGRSILDAMPATLRTQRVVDAVDPNPKKPGNWQEAPIRVLSPYSCPAVLVEVCQASNAADLAVLQSPWGLLGITAAMMAGVARMMQIEASR
jgi:N-acetylmuramoyl-L-alanine amidase